MNTPAIEERQASDGFVPVKSADRVLQILEALGSSALPLSLAELARTRRIPKSSLHSLIATLLHRGWVELDGKSGRYSLGIRSLQLASSYLDLRGLTDRAATTLDWLAVASDETVQFARLDNTEVVYLAKRQSRHPVQLISDVGTRLPVNATALGKAILAEYTDDEIRGMLPASLPALTKRSLTSLDALLAQLADVRQRGYAVDDEEAIEGISCFAVALPQRRTATTDAISVSIPQFRMTEATEQTVAKLLLKARGQLAI